MRRGDEARRGQRKLKSLCSGSPADFCGSRFTISSTANQRMRLGWKTVNSLHSEARRKPVFPWIAAAEQQFTVESDGLSRGEC